MKFLMVVCISLHSWNAFSFDIKGVDSYAVVETVIGQIVSQERLLETDAKAHSVLQNYLVKSSKSHQELEGFSCVYIGLDEAQDVGAAHRCTIEFYYILGDEEALLEVIYEQTAGQITSVKTTYPE